MDEGNPNDEHLRPQYYWSFTWRKKVTKKRAPKGHQNATSEIVTLEYCTKTDGKIFSTSFVCLISFAFYDQQELPSTFWNLTLHSSHHQFHSGQMLSKEWCSWRNCIIKPFPFFLSCFSRFFIIWFSFDSYNLNFLEGFLTYSFFISNHPIFTFYLLTLLLLSPRFNISAVSYYHTLFDIIYCLLFK